MIDYLIVGSGLAGICFAETALQNDKSILVFEDESQISTKVAGGLYNPVILKRFSAVWQSQKQMELLNEFYPKLEQKLGTKFDYKIPVYRKFFSIEEQNNWFLAADKPDLSPFLSLKLVNKNYKSIVSPYGFGEVLGTGYLDTKAFLDSYWGYLSQNNWLVQTTFDYGKLEIHNDHIGYEGVKARKIVFAEGFGLHQNPFFSRLPLDGTKGELLIIKTPDLDLDVIINTNMFILPLGNDLYKVGATYNRDDKTNLPTKEGKEELVERLREIIDCKFEIVSHFAGVRPTVRDRKPLVGIHSEHQNVAVLNGLGTRGVMLGPAMAKDLFDHLEYGKPLDPVIDIKRFKKKNYHSLLSGS